MRSMVRAIAAFLLVVSGCTDAHLEDYWAGEYTDGVDPVTDDDLENWLEDELPDGSDGSLSAISCDQRWFPPIHTSETAARQNVPYDRTYSNPCLAYARLRRGALSHVRQSSNENRKPPNGLGTAKRMSSRRTSRDGWVFPGNPQIRPLARSLRATRFARIRMCRHVQ